jgi:hypothetical protein
MYAPSTAPPALVAAIRSIAASDGTPIVSLRAAPTLRLVVRLDHPVAELHQGRLVPLMRLVGERLQGRGWEVVAVDRRGEQLRYERGLPIGVGGEGWIRPDLDGCDPSFQVMGRPAVPLFSSTPRCAGDPPAPATHPSDVGGAVVGRSFPLTVAIVGQRVVAEVNGARYASRLMFPGPTTVGSAVLRTNTSLVVTLAGIPVALARA